MSRNTSRGLAILQKTYDDSYLKCSTAVYYEGQGDEDEAMRCWRNALSQLSDHRASKVLPDFTPRSETEKALIDSLRELELQCKERIDLLEALRISRQENMGRISSSSSGDKFAQPGDSADSFLPPQGKGWIGQGTIPAVTYPELSRPALPKRPSLPNHTVSEKAIVGAKASGSESGPDLGSSARLPVASSSSSAGQGNKDVGIRSPSPEKHTMRTTLRNRNAGEKTSKPTRKLAKSEGPGASKAATLAWSALTAKDRLTKGLGSNNEASSSYAIPQSTTDHSRKPLATSPLQWDVHTRRLVTSRDTQATVTDPLLHGRHSDEYSYARPSALSVNAASSALRSVPGQETAADQMTPKRDRWTRNVPPQTAPPARAPRGDALGFSEPDDPADRRKSTSDTPTRHKAVVEESPRHFNNMMRESEQERTRGRTKPTARRSRAASEASSVSDHLGQLPPAPKPIRRKPKSKPKAKEDAIVADEQAESEGGDEAEYASPVKSAWQKKKKAILKSLPSGVDEASAKQILNEIVVQGDEVRWTDVAGLEVAKSALRENVVYPFLRPDLFMGLREPARGMLLFGPPGTGKTMLARAVATESCSTFFSISASSLTSKFLGESEKLVRALFLLAKELAPSIIFVDEIDSLLSRRSGSGEHEATRRIKTEFLIQWSDLQRAAAGRAVDDNDKDTGDPNRVLVLAATNLPWAIDEAARRRFVRRQYIPLPEPETRSTQLRTLLGLQKHDLTDPDIEKLVVLTDGFSGSDITALAKDAAMGPLRSLGEALLQMSMEEIRPINLADFEASLATIRPSVSKAGLKEYEDWANEFGERGG